MEACFCHIENKGNCDSKLRFFFLTILRKRILKTLELWDIKSEFWLYSCNSMFTSFNFEFTPRNFVFFLTSWNKKGNCNFLSHSFLTSTFSLTIVSLYLTNCGFLANLRGKKARILRKVQIVRYNLSCKGEKSELWKKKSQLPFLFLYPAVETSFHNFGPHWLSLYGEKYIFPPFVFHRRKTTTWGWANHFFRWTSY